MAANDLSLGLRIRVNDDGSVSVINQTTRGVNQLASATQATSRQLAFFSSGLLRVGDIAQMAAGSLSLLALATTGRSLVDFADSLQSIESRIKLATTGVADFSKAQAALVAISLRSHSALEGNAAIFSRTNKAIESMGGSVGTTLAVTDLLAKSIKISGKATSEQMALTTQLAQAFASGVLRGDEFNSVMENGSRVVYALADGLNVNVGQLRAMAEGGELTTNKILPALLSQYQKVSEEFARLPVTVAGAFTNVQTAFGQYVQSANAASGATGLLASGVDAIAGHLTPILNGLMLVGETAVAALAIKGVGAMSALVSAHAALVIARQADTAAATAATQAALRHATTQLLDVRATQAAIVSSREAALVQLSVSHASVASARADVQRFGAMAQGTVITQRLALAEQQRATVLRELAILGEQQSRSALAATAAVSALATAEAAATGATVSWAASVRLLLNPMNALNVAMVGFMGFQFGTWLNSFSSVANAATQWIGAWAKRFESLSYWAQAAYAAVSGQWSSIDALTAAHQRNVQAIDENVNGTLAYRNALDKANLSEQQRLDLLLSLRSPVEVFKEKSAEITTAFNNGLLPLEAYTRGLVALKDQFDQLNAVKVSGFAKELARLQDDQAKVSLSPQDYYAKTVTQFSKDPLEQAQLVEENAKLLALQDAQKEKQAAITTAVKATRREVSEEVKAQEALTKDYQQRLAQLEREMALRGVTNRAGLLEYDLQHTALQKLSEAQALLLLQKSAELDNADKLKTVQDAQKTSLDSLRDSYLQLTLSKKAYLLSKLTDQGVTTPEQTAPIIAQFDKNEAVAAQQKQIDDTRSSLDAYNASLDQSKEKMQGLGEVSTTVFDAALGGISSLVNAFGRLGQSLEENAEALSDLRDKQAQNAAWQGADREKDAVQWAKDQATKASNTLKYAAEEQSLTKKNALLGIDGARQVAGAAASMFGQKTAAARAFHALEMGLAVLSMAMKMKEIAVSIFATGKSVAAGAAKMFEQSGWLGFAGVAAMIAVMAGLGFAGGGGGTVEPPKESPSTGTVLGDSSKQSESIGNISKTLKDIHASEFPELHGINQGMANLQGALTGMITTFFRANGVDGLTAGVDVNGVNKPSFLQSVVSNFPVLGWLGFGSSSSGIEHAGIRIPAQSMTDINENRFTAKQTYTVRTVTDYLFFSEVSRTNVETALDEKLVASLAKVFKSAGQVALELAVSLGSDLTSQINSYQFPNVQIELQGLNSDDASKKVNAVLSTALDTMAETVFGKIVGDYQRLGEGMLETAARVVIGVGQAKGTLAQFGLTTIAFTDIVNKQGDIGVEIVRQSLLKAVAGQSGLTAMIQGFDGAVTDLVSSYKDWLAVRRLMQSTGISLQAVDAWTVQGAGGLSALTSGLQAFNDKYFSDTEQLAARNRVMAESFQSLGLALPSSTSGFRELVLSLDASTESGKTLLGRLLPLSDSFAQLAKDSASYQQSLTTLHTALSAVGLSKAAVSDTSIMQAGGSSVLSSSLASFNDKYFSDAEKADAKLREMVLAFAALKVVMPSSTAGFRELVLGLDTSTEAGKTLLNQLLALSAGFSAVSASAGSALSSLQDAVKSQFDVAKGLLSKQSELYSGFVSSLSSLRQSLVSGSLSTAAPESVYNTSRSQFLSIKAVLDNPLSATAQRESALSSLSSVAQAFLESSQSFNGSGMGYVSDFATVNGTVAQALGESQAVKSTADLQLAQLTTQVTQLGLIKASVDDVVSAVDAVTSAIADLRDFKQGAGSANGYAQQGGRLEAAASQRGLTGTSSKYFEVKNQFDPMTNKNLGDYSLKIDSLNQSGVQDILTKPGGQFERVRNLFSQTASIVSKVIGQPMPAVTLTLSKAAQTYQFANRKITMQGDSIDELLRHFAGNSVDYLAGLLPDKSLASQLKAVDFSSLASGFFDLSTLMNKEGVSIDGHHKSGLLRVPFDGYIAQLHKDERVLSAPEARVLPAVLSPVVPVPVRAGSTTPLVTVVVQQSALLAQAVALLEKVNSALGQQLAGQAQSIEVDRFAAKKLLEQAQLQADALTALARQQRLAV